MERRDFMNRVGLTLLSAAIPASLLKTLAPSPTQMRFSLYDVNGQTEFLRYGDNGLLDTDTVSYLVHDKCAWGFNPRKTSLKDAQLEFEQALQPKLAE